jgi:hypothetical protein
LWKWPPTGTPSAAARETTERGDADRVCEDERVGAGFGDAARDLEDAPGVDLALERTAEGDAQRDGGASGVLTGAGNDAAGGGERFRDARALVALVERLGDAEREADLLHPGGRQALVPALVERETGARHTRQCADGRNHLLRLRHLRHAPGVHEARHLDRRHSRRGESPDELCAGRNVEDVGFVLQAVARADLVQRHTPRAHGRGHLTRPGVI